MPNRPAQLGSRQLDNVQLEAFARQVLSTLSQQASERQQRPTTASDLMLEIALSPQGFDGSAADIFSAMPDLTTPDILDICIPDVARRAGQMWVDDKLSFAEVTRVGSRLHDLCKALSGGWTPSRHIARINVMIVTMPGEQHLIGPVLLASQLRRRGCSVKLSTGAPLEENVAILTQGQFDAVLISVANSFALDSATRFVSLVKGAIYTPPRLVIGGAIGEEASVSCRKTGADLTTSNIKIALAGLGGLGLSSGLLAAQ